MYLFTRWANKLIDASLGNRIDPSGIWIGLSTKVPGTDGSGWVEVDDAKYGGYARVNVAGLIPGAAGGLTMNNAPIDFPIPTIGGAMIGAIGVFSDPTAAPNVAGRFFVPLQPAILIVAGRRPEIRASSFSISAS